MSEVEEEFGSMTPSEARVAMNKAKFAGDAEDQHYSGDSILCALLINLGHEDIVEAWSDLEKWYA